MSMIQTQNPTPVAARLEADIIRVTMDDGSELRIPRALTPRLAGGTDAQCADMELLSCSIHWPQIDEDLDIEALIKDGYHHPHG